MKLIYMKLIYMYRFDSEDLVGSIELKVRLHLSLY